jgi:hypothetical protein
MTSITRSRIPRDFTRLLTEFDTVHRQASITSSVGSAKRALDEMFRLQSILIDPRYMRFTNDPRINAQMRKGVDDVINKINDFIIEFNKHVRQSPPFNHETSTPSSESPRGPREKQRTQANTNSVDQQTTRKRKTNVSSSSSQRPDANSETVHNESTAANGEDIREAFEQQTQADTNSVDQQTTRKRKTNVSSSSSQRPDANSETVHNESTAVNLEDIQEAPTAERRKKQRTNHNESSAHLESSRRPHAEVCVPAEAVVAPDTNNTPTDTIPTISSHSSVHLASPLDDPESTKTETRLNKFFIKIFYFHELNRNNILHGLEIPSGIIQAFLQIIEDEYSGLPQNVRNEVLETLNQRIKFESSLRTACIAFHDENILILSYKKTREELMSKLLNCTNTKAQTESNQSRDVMTLISLFAQCINIRFNQTVGDSKIKSSSGGSSNSRFTTRRSKLDLIRELKVNKVIAEMMDVYKTQIINAVNNLPTQQRASLLLGCTNPSASSTGNMHLDALIKHPSFRKLILHPDTYSSASSRATRQAVARPSRNKTSANPAPSTRLDAEVHVTASNVSHLIGHNEVMQPPNFLTTQSGIDRDGNRSADATQSADEARLWQQSQLLNTSETFLFNDHADLLNALGLGLLSPLSADSDTQSN